MKLPNAPPNADDHPAITPGAALDRAKRPCATCGALESDELPFLRNGDGVGVCAICIVNMAHALDHRSRAQRWSELQELPSPRAIRAKLDEHVVGQERAKVDLAVAVYHHYKRRRYEQLHDKAPEVAIQKSNILLVGPTGTGKTELARAMARMLGVPLHVVDATRFTASGYIGEDVGEILTGLVAAADGDLARAAWGIVFIDEIDKIARRSGRLASGQRDIGGEAVQQELLRLVEGEVREVPSGGKVRVVSGPAVGRAPMLDTTNILFICAGSFAGSIAEVVGRRVNAAARIGFGGPTTRRRELTEREIFDLVNYDDMLDLGIIPELAGRLPVLTSTSPLTEDEMLRILTEPKHAILKQYQALFSMDGVTLEVDKDALRLLARTALTRPTGARALRSLLEQVLKQPVYEHAGEAGVRGIRITKECVERREGAELAVEEGRMAPQRVTPTELHASGNLRRENDPV